MESNKSGLLAVISGPSGTGKGTVVGELMKQTDANLHLSVSATTRKPRENELPGVHYHFVAQDYFRAMIDKGKLLEFTEYAGNYYGTPLFETEKSTLEGKNVILEIEVTGGIQVRKKNPNAILIFLAPPSIDELERRLRGRHTEEEDVIKNRLRITLAEFEAASRYDYIVQNNHVEDAVQDILAILRAERLKAAREYESIRHMKEILGGKIV